MSFPRYPKYKDSGVEWLGEVPEHWDVTVLRRLASEEQDSFVDGDWIESPYITDEGVRLLQTGNIGVGEFKEQGFRFVSPETFESLRCTEVRPSDVLICRLAEPVGRACLAPDLGVRMITSVDVCILRPGSHIHPRFIVHLLSSAQYLGHMEGQCRGGTRDRVSRTFLGSVRVAIPSRNEQAAIASFLDRETAKIDSLIAEQQRLVGLLDEQLKAVVLSAFNAPSTAMVRLGAATDVVSRPLLGESGTTYTRLGLYNRGRGIFHKDPSEPEEMGDSDFFWVEEGDLILSGQFAWEGAVAIAGPEESRCVVSHRYPIVRGKPGILRTEFLFALLCTAHGDFLLNENSRGAAGRNRPLNIGSLLKEKVPVPDIRLQDNAAQIYHQRQGLLKEVAIQHALLQERRSALISAAVTGQIDVRGLAGSEAA